MPRAATAAALALALSLGVPAAAHAAPARTIIQGDVLRLESVQDVEAMAAMVPGVPVSWDVGVSASRADGDIALQLEVDATDEAFSTVIASCAVAWDADGCATGEAILAEAPLDDGVVVLGEQPSGEQRWYRIAVVLDIDLGDHRADLVFRATGLGDDVASGGDVGLPPTGLDVPGLGIGLAIMAVGGGILLAALARRRREVDA
ncbi:hypothetical protein SAMN04489720_0641 [Agrococcus jejuensis]|uniref:LPXTG-motif cell wall anchor domain-containing protein n=2 Tax=Agrococcus jejuensis TaxID=399736 RepID=A0A1G8B4V9_9MICO|nr:hypothetical protein SAMN04489720_0641 [Agrococcus jejuensis]